MSVTRWDPGRYLHFGDQRLRPAADLLARVDVDRPRRVVDLGCGPGTSTALLARRWPDAHVVGVDTDLAMLETARAAAGRIREGAAGERATGHVGIGYVEGDIAEWARRREPPEVDVVFSNAALHWLDDHEWLLPALYRRVAPGGALAVQVPDNWAEPSHTVAVEVASDPRWVARVGHLVRRDPLLGPAAYHELLAATGARVDVWSTTYVHELTGDRPVVEWMSGSLLGPVLEALEPHEADDFLAAYGARIEPAYPRWGDVTLFGFRRLFLVAHRPA